VTRSDKISISLQTTVFCACIIASVAKAAQVSLIVAGLYCLGAVAAFALLVAILATVGAFLFGGM
jgi:hypothetical protein